MLITNLKIENFRNYNKLNLNLNNKINIFYGNNAQGKTNIIESIFLCSIGKSFRTSKDKELVKFDKDFFRIEVQYKKSDRDGKIKIEYSDKKHIFINGIKVKKFSELLGKINIVIFTPDDINILKDGPKMRRRFLDIMISQLRPNYIYCLNMYTKTLEQRNAYLKQIKLEHKSEDLLDLWNQKLYEYGEKIYKYRLEFIEKIKEKINDIHKKVTDGNEEIKIEYISDFSSEENFYMQLKQNQKIDIIRGATSKGIHKDDFIVYLNGKNVNTYGSQGQNRTVVLSLKMSELQVIKDEIGENPILLLDDFMSELDKERRKNFLENIGDTQVFVTCTDKIDIENLNSNIYNVIDGEVFLRKDWKSNGKIWTWIQSRANTSLRRPWSCKKKTWYVHWKCIYKRITSLSIRDCRQLCWWGFGWLLYTYRSYNRAREYNNCVR